MELKTNEWKEFRIGDWFNVDCCTGINAGTLTLNDEEDHKYSYEFIGRTNSDYGVQGYAERQSVEPNDAETITVSQVGTIVAQYRSKEYYASQNIFRISSKEVILNQKQLLFVTSCLNALCKKYTGYSSYPTQTELIDSKLLLPVKDNKPDWVYMEEYIKYIEDKYIERVDEQNKKRIKEALSYCGLSEKDLEGELKLPEVERYEEFRIGTLFKVISSKKIYHASRLTISKDEEDNLYPYVVRSTQNRGIRGYINKESKYLNDKDTLSFAQDTFISFYQGKPYFTGNKVKILKPLFNASKTKLLYIQTALNKSILSKTWGTGSTVNSINDIEISLPAIDKNTPDFETMETYIYIYIYIKRRIKDWEVAGEKEVELLKQLVKGERS